MNGHAQLADQLALDKQEVAICVSIVTNSHLLSEGLVSLLQSHFSLRVVDIYSSDMVVTLDLPNPTGHIVLLDSSIGHERTLALIQSWRRLPNPALVVVLELMNDAQLILNYIEAGANGYLERSATIADVARTIQQVAHGLVQCSPEITARLFERVASLSSAVQIGRNHNHPFTPREFEILNLIAKGYGNKEIAQYLFVEIRTVKHHVHNILRKLTVQHRWEAARIAQQSGWLSYSL